MMISVAIMFIGVCIFLSIPDKLLLMFDASPTMLEIGTPALRIISTHFILAGCTIIIMSTFQAFGEGFLSLMVSVLRQLLIILPVAYLLVKFAGLAYVWWSFPVAEMFALSLSIIFFIRLYRTKIKTL